MEPLLVDHHCRFTVSGTGQILEYQTPYVDKEKHGCLYQIRSRNLDGMHGTDMKTFDVTRTSSRAQNSVHPGMSSAYLYLFADNSLEFVADHTYYHLSPSGATFLVEASNPSSPERCKQLTSLVTTKHIDIIKFIMSIRNSCVETPYLSARLCSDQELKEATLVGYTVDAHSDLL